jgi:diguanylate cyclase (GGDEF)-like protein/PAS domain S-box-containing protein
MLMAIAPHSDYFCPYGLHSQLLSQPRLRHNAKIQLASWNALAMISSFQAQQPSAPSPVWEADAWRRLTGSVFARNLNGIIICDAGGAIVDVNAAFSAITGYGRNEVLEQNTSLFRPWTDSPRPAMWKALLRQGVWQGEIARRRKNGEQICARLAIYAVHDEGQRPSHYIGVVSDITLEKEQQRRLTHYDPLTGLPNREFLCDHLQQTLAWADRRGQLIAVCHLDVDAFKAINDRHGRHIGNQILTVIAKRLRQALREGDTLARLGGDAFVLLLKGLTSVQEAHCILQRLLQVIAAPTDVAATLGLSASIGVSFFPKDGDNPDTLLRHASQAMYRAKDEGRATYHIFEGPPEGDRRAQRALQQEVRNALCRQQFCLHYQPKISLQQGRVVGAEALIRWAHPQRGLLPPAAFLTAVDDAELAAAIDRWVLGEALRQMAAWAAAGLHLPVSVNISAQLLQQADFEDWLGAALASAGLPVPCALELEILESAALPDLPRLRRLIEDCARFGVTFALDDFGTGYSSLTYLRQLPAATIKIDRSFVQDMLANGEDLAIVKGVLALAGAFGRQVVVEGVETPAHGRLLAQLGGDVIQGYGISYPLPAEAIAGWVAGFSLSLEWHPASQP